MSSDEFDREPAAQDLCLLADPGDDVALGCESALPFLTSGAEPAHLEETRPWTNPSPR